MRSSYLLLVVMFVVVMPNEPVGAQEQNQVTQTPLVTRAQVEAALKLPWPAVKFEGEQPLSLLLEQVEQYMVEQTGVPLSFVADKQELQLEGVSLNEIPIQYLNLRSGSMTIEAGLAHYFAQTEPQLAVMPNNGYLLVTTRAKSDSTLETVVYDLGPFILEQKQEPQNTLSRLVAPKAVTEYETPTDQLAAGSAIEQDQQAAKPKRVRNKSKRTKRSLDASTNSTYGSSKLADNSSLLELIQQQTSVPCTWRNLHGEGGWILVHGQYAFITQTRSGHHMIVDVLNMMQQAVSEGGPVQETNFERYHRSVLTTQGSLTNASVGAGYFSIADQSTDGGGKHR